MKLLALLLVAPLSAFAGTITATYTAPTQFMDGTTIDQPLTYVLYAAPEGQPLAEVQRSSSLSMTVTVAAGRWCAQVFAVNGNIWSDGAPSAPACVTVPSPTQTSRKPRPVGSVVVTPGQ